MHVSDGFLEVPVIAATTVASVGILSVVAKRTPAAELTSPMVGASAAFVIAAQMVNFPVAASVSGHIIGGVLVAILLGWRVSVLVMTAVLVIQAMLFQDGGIAALCQCPESGDRRTGPGISGVSGYSREDCGRPGKSVDLP